MLGVHSGGGGEDLENSAPYRLFTSHSYYKCFVYFMDVPFFFFLNHPVFVLTLIQLKKK